MYEKIEIGIIDNDAGHEDTILQIANCLDDLQSAASYIFKSIDDRLAVYKNRLTGVKEKTCRIQEKLQYLQNNMNMKATKMYSDSKYPANSTYKEYKTIISIDDDKESILSNKLREVSRDDEKKSKIGESWKKAISNSHYSTEVNLKDKLQFYYVKPLNDQDNQPLIETKKSSLLSADYVSSVSALLINECLKTDTPVHHLYGIDNKEIQDAPDSISQPWHSLDFDSPSYLYAPTLGEVPQINVPAILPDLPGIVDDEKFVLDLSSQSPIAPSSALTSPIVKIDLPEDVSLPGINDKPVDKLLQSPNLPNINDVDTASELAKLPPPPPPPPSESIQQQNSSIVISSNIQTLPSPPPPPPPPPPPTITSISSSTEQTIDAKNNIKIPIAPVDDRTNLMAAIRAAGGIGKAKLKPATDEVEKPNERWSSASVGGDLMADLHAKLSLRRKGIAGGGGGGSSGGMGALERISRLIPPPPKPSEDINSATSDNDSQVDADEWEE